MKVGVRDQRVAKNSHQGKSHVQCLGPRQCRKTPCKHSGGSREGQSLLWEVGWSLPSCPWLKSLEAWNGASAWQIPSDHALPLNSAWMATLVSVYKGFAVCSPQQLVKRNCTRVGVTGCWEARQALEVSCAGWGWYYGGSATSPFLHGNPT